MTKEEFEALKQEADILSCSEIFDVYFERLANAVEKATKEKAAKVVDSLYKHDRKESGYDEGWNDALDIAEQAIRSMK